MELGSSGEVLEVTCDFLLSTRHMKQRCQILGLLLNSIFRAGLDWQSVTRFSNSFPQEKGGSFLK